MAKRKKRNVSLEKAKCMARVGDMYLKGHNKTMIAVALGIERHTVARHIDEIRKGWIRSDTMSFIKKQLYRVKEVELVIQEAFEAWKRSQQSEVETRIVISFERCQATGCVDGMVGEEWCIACEGEGKVEVETTTTRVKGQAGDAAHLNAILKAIDLAAKLESLYQDNDKPRRHIIEGAMVHVNGNRWSGASSENLLKARRLLEGLGGGTKVIDVETKIAKEKNDDGDVKE